jgi:hypothetical protein
MLAHPSTILPEDLPEHPYVPLPGIELGNAAPTALSPDVIIGLNGQNVFVTLTSGKTIVGLLECGSKYFSVGRDDEWFEYSQISNFRRV